MSFKKLSLPFSLIAILFLSGCVGRITSTSMTFDGETPAGQKIFHAKVKLNGNQLQSANLVVSKTSATGFSNQLFEDTFPNVSPSRTTFTSSANPINGLGRGDKIEAVWTFSFSGGTATPAHEKIATYTFINSKRDVKLLSWKLLANGEEAPFENIDGYDIYTLNLDTTYSLDVLVKNNAPDPSDVDNPTNSTRFPDTLSIKVTEHFLGGSSPSGQDFFNIKRQFSEGLAANQEKTFTIHNLKFTPVDEDPDAPHTRFREIHVKVITPTAVLDSNINNNESTDGKTIRFE